MWQHEIIESLPQVRHLYGRDAHKIDNVVHLVANSNAFYFGARSNMDKVQRNPELYSKDGNFTFPYEVCLFENVEDLDGQKQKKANLIFKNDDYWCFAFFVEAFTDVSRTSTQWAMPLPIVIMEPIQNPDIFHDENFNTVNIKDKIFLRTFSDIYDTECKGYFGDGVHNIEDLAFQEASNTLIMLSLLNCNNIVTKTLVPPEKLNRTRVRKGKEPLREYKILEVVKGIPKQKDMGTEAWSYRPGHETTFHMCRGHFKTYTSDAPLFGRYTGTFWWQPQARGSKDNGEIVKDYSVNMGDKHGNQSR